jgi:protoporphyrinogen oxidase
VAIVGAGPAGAFPADRLLRRRGDAEIDLFERLPTPWGYYWKSVELPPLTDGAIETLVEHSTPLAFNCSIVDAASEIAADCSLVAEADSLAAERISAAAAASRPAVARICSSSSICRSICPS